MYMYMYSANLRFPQGSSSLRETHQCETSVCVHLMPPGLSDAPTGQQISRTSDLSIQQKK